MPVSMTTAWALQFRPTSSANTTFWASTRILNETDNNNKKYIYLFLKQTKMAKRKKRRETSTDAIDVFFFLVVCVWYYEWNSSPTRPTPTAPLPLYPHTHTHWGFFFCDSGSSSLERKSFIPLWTIYSHNAPVFGLRGKVSGHRWWRFYLLIGER